MEKKFKKFLAKAIPHVRWVLEGKNLQILLAKTVVFIKGVLERKSFKSFWPDSPFPSSG